MTERDYQQLLDTVQEAIDAGDPAAMRFAALPAAANDNSAEWPLIPFPQGWQASP